MLNVIELENRWRKYKIKSYIPYISIFLIVTLVIVLAVFFIKPQETKKVALPVTPIFPKVNSVKRDIKKPKIIERKQEIVKKVLDRKEELKKVVLTPSLNFISSIKYDYDKKITYKELKPKSKPKPKKQFQKEKIVLKEDKKTIEQEPLKRKYAGISIKINEQNTQQDINEVLKRFKKNNNPALSLFVAKKYYEIKNYRQSYNYALITNGINDEIEISWIIFAKSLVKLGKKDEAIKTLRKYVKHTNSNQAKILLEDIISGKFR